MPRCFWRAYGLERFSVLVAPYLQSQGGFDAVVQRFVGSATFSASLAESGKRFLDWLATDGDPIVASLARTELALHRTQCFIKKGLHFFQAATPARSYGVKVHGRIEQLIAKLRLGFPIAVGWLHHGPASPFGRGLCEHRHWQRRPSGEGQIVSRNDSTGATLSQFALQKAPDRPAGVGY